jgi:hypothetical protein
MAKEREISGPLPRTIELPSGNVRAEGPETLIFGGAEYVKDGLLSIVERLGRGPWFDRMEEIVRAIIDRAPVETRLGKIPSNGTEVNGDLLQVLPRLYWATGKNEYLEMAERIAEVYLFEMMPKNNGLPAASWNFKEAKPYDPAFGLRDHGNEIVPALSEIYFLEKLRKRPQAERYREPLKAFLDLLLYVGRTKEGLWYNRVSTKTHRVRKAGIIDNWGYLLNAYKTFDLAEGTNAYDEEIQRAMRGAAALKSYQWEGFDQDGYADTIESMLYQLQRFDLPECRLWVDDEIEVMFLKQLDSGFVEGTYLDGNFVRTAMLYANYKTGGARIDAWRADVRLGAAQNKKKGDLYLYLNADAPWKGALHCDYPRHRAVWNMTVDYPRLNSWPEWFVVEPGERYTVSDLDSGGETQVSGGVLANGFVIELDGTRPVRLRISERKTPSASARAAKTRKKGPPKKRAH